MLVLAYCNSINDGLDRYYVLHMLQCRERLWLQKHETASNPKLVGWSLSVAAEMSELFLIQRRVSRPKWCSRILIIPDNTWRTAKAKTAHAGSRRCSMRKYSVWTGSLCNLSEKVSNSTLRPRVSTWTVVCLIGCCELDSGGESDAPDGGTNCPAFAPGY